MADKLTDKQQRFVEEYCKDFNKTQAAIRAGYSEKMAYSIGWENTKKPEIKAAIDDRLKDLALTSDETLKSISDIARASLNDYFVIRKEVVTRKVQKPLVYFIDKLQAEMAFEEEYAEVAQLSDNEYDEYHETKQRKERELLRLQIQQKHYPNATMLEVETVTIEVAELDLPRLIKDKEAGRIKSITPSDHGIKVEMYAADAALRDLARVHGLFEKDNEQGKTEINLIDARNALAAKLAKGQE